MFESIEYNKLWIHRNIYIDRECDVKLKERSISFLPEQKKKIGKQIDKIH